MQALSKVGENAMDQYSTLPNQNFSLNTQIAPLTSVVCVFSMLKLYGPPGSVVNRFPARVAVQQQQIRNRHIGCTSRNESYAGPMHRRCQTYRTAARLGQVQMAVTELR